MHGLLIRLSRFVVLACVEKVVALPVVIFSAMTRLAGPPRGLVDSRGREPVSPVLPVVCVLPAVVVVVVVVCLCGCAARTERATVFFSKRFAACARFGAGVKMPLPSLARPRRSQKHTSAAGNVLSGSKVGESRQGQHQKGNGYA